MHFLRTPYSNTDNAALEATTAQTLFTTSHTRVVLKGLSSHNPFTSTAGPSDFPHDTTTTPPMLAEHILGGTIFDANGNALENPIVKLTTDAAYNKYYLTAHRENADQLIRYGKFLAKVLVDWIGLSTPLRLDLSDALLHRPTLEEHHTQVSSKTPTIAPATPPTMDESLLSMVHDIHRMMQRYEQDITSLKEQITAPPRSMDLHGDVISAVQSSITTAIVLNSAE